MHRWLWLLLVVGSVALAGPFELVPANQDGYQRLATLRGAGLLDTGIAAQATGELTRFEFAQLWTTAYEALQDRLEAHPGPVAAEHPQVTKVTQAMRALMATFGPELQQIDIDLTAAGETLALLPQRLPDLRAPAPAVSAPRRTPGAEQIVRPAPRGAISRHSALADDPFTMDSDPRLMPGRSANVIGGRLPAGELGPASAGLSLNQVTWFEYDDDGPTEFLKGQVLAADLRLKLGDNSVLLEYARSAQERFGALFDADAGDAFKATYARELSNHLSVDLGFHRLSSRFTPFSEMFQGTAASDMYGLRAGLAIDTGGLGIQSHATVYRPEGQRVGYANRFDTEMSYQVADNFTLDLGYMAANRRRLHNLEDALLQQFTAGIEIGASDRFRAELNYRFDSDQSGGETSHDHVIGASLGLGF